MYIVVGLGNPSRKYENTRHNIGFELIDYIARTENVKVKKLKHKALIGEFIHAGEKVLLVKPQTFMNLSGDSVLSLLNYYNINLEKLIVVYDDIDIPLGNVRIRKSGSAGSHNGMKDIIYKIKDNGFPRIRIGIGKPDKIDLKNFVLSGYSKEEVPIMEEAVVNTYKAVMTIIEQDIDIAMNKYNSKKKKKEKKNSETSAEDSKEQ